MTRPPIEINQKDLQPRRRPRKWISLALEALTLPFAIAGAAVTLALIGMAAKAMGF